MKKLLLLSIFCLSARASAPAPDIEKKITSAWGKLYPMGNMHYLSEDPQKLVYNSKLKNVLDENQQPIVLKSSDVIVDVQIDSQESENWGSHGHPVLGSSFPNALPLSMLEGKNEGEPLIFKLNCPQKNAICNILVLCHGQNGEGLKSQINRTKERFAVSPNFTCGDEKRLLAQQILIKNPAYDEMEKQKTRLRNLPTPFIFTPPIFAIFGGDNPQSLQSLSQHMMQEKELIDMMQQKKEEYHKTNPLIPFGNIPEYLHGPNGFKLTPEAPAEASSSSSSASSKPVINPDETE